MPEISPSATWIPTPVRKPISTVRERKSAMNPRPISLAKMRKPAAMKASTAASATYSSEPVAASPNSPAARIAAVAESAPTTRCREEPNSANRAIGIRIVYRPVITGVPEILV